ncbi:ATP-dependent caseinolytic (Clp)protease/crotonase family protein [Striga asiatica]|uniref:ATP-dependent caseinolytic (Clp)protease/crotonase family protein n=1 Tax=Striga asiatica TaxID=4170 RepID=A0A5A7QZE3_STRAF|nr:ATP-dependent caseinolytic (Clp)protease/crotonase family protein [Striga asiatica]
MDFSLSAPQQPIFEDKQAKMQEPRKRWTRKQAKVASAKDGVSWKEDLLRRCFSHSECQAILQINTLSRHLQDKATWSFNPRQVFRAFLRLLLLPDLKPVSSPLIHFRSWSDGSRSGQFPLCTQSSREHSLQKVWPQGIKAAPLCLTIHTQQPLCPPPPATAPLSSASPLPSPAELSNPICRSFSASRAINDILTGGSALWRSGEPKFSNLSLERPGLGPGSVESVGSSRVEGRRVITIISRWLPPIRTEPPLARRPIFSLSCRQLRRPSLGPEVWSSRIIGGTSVGGTGSGAGDLFSLRMASKVMLEELWRLPPATVVEVLVRRSSSLIRRKSRRLCESNFSPAPTSAIVCNAIVIVGVNQSRIEVIITGKGEKEKAKGKRKRVLEEREKE